MLTKKQSFLLLLSLLILLALTCTAALLREYNSDDVYPYSQALDIIEFRSLSGWVYSAIPFTIPDIIFALPIVAVVHQPFLFHIFSAPLELVCFVLVYTSMHPKRRHSFTEICAAISVAATICLVIGLLVFRKPFYFLVEPFFILAHHGGAAIAAVLFLTAKEQGFVTRSKLMLIFFAIVAVALTASDLFFAFYLGFLLLFSCKRVSWRRDTVILALVIVQALIVFILSWKLNPSLSIQAHHSGGGGHLAIEDRIKFVFHTLWLSVPVIALSVWAIRRNTPDFRAFPYACGTIAAANFAAVAGLISDEYTYRYAAVLYPVEVLLVSELILLRWVKRLPMIALAGLTLLLVALAVVATNRGLRSHDVFTSEISCLQKIGVPGSTIVAEYWPAKIVFESLDRRFNLLQVNSNGDRHDWINNLRWAKIFPHNGIEYLITDGLSPSAITKLIGQNTYTTLCGGKILQLTREHD